MPPGIEGLDPRQVARSGGRAGHPAELPRRRIGSADPRRRDEIARRIVNNKALDRYRAFEMNPGDRLQTDDELLGFAPQYGHTAYHVVGTCKMGHDLKAIVNDELRVHGVAGLRVVDASIMPTMTSGNTNAPVIMIAEKAADMVKIGLPAGADRRAACDVRFSQFSITISEMPISPNFALF
jgi:choline dehydrogenase-like flavoprotein